LGRYASDNQHAHVQVLTSSSEWVHQSRLLRRDETNLALQRKLQQTQRAAIGKDPTSHKAKERDPNKEREKERDREPKFPKKELRVKQPKPKEDDFDEIDYQPPLKKRQELKLSIPEVLKVALVNDWEAVTRHGQLVSLPRSPCVDDILLEFKEYVLELPEANRPPDIEEKLPSVLIGLKQYFDACVHQRQCLDVKLLTGLPSSALGAHLLYRFERAQYADIRRQFIESPDLPPEQWKSESQIYGAEHLVRLIGRCFLCSWTCSATDDARSILTGTNDSGEDGASGYEHYPRLFFATITVSSKVALFCTLV